MKIDLKVQQVIYSRYWFFLLWCSNYCFYRRNVRSHYLDLAAKVIDIGYGLWPFCLHTHQKNIYIPCLKHCFSDFWKKEKTYLFDMERDKWNLSLLLFWFLWSSLLMRKLQEKTFKYFLLCFIISYDFWYDSLYHSHWKFFFRSVPSVLILETNMMDSDHDKCWPKKQNSSGRWTSYKFEILGFLLYVMCYTLILLK